MKSISVVIPAKNEAESLQKLLPELINHLPDAEIIVVNDGSWDSTEKVCLKNNIRCITNEHSMGNGAAIKRGARAVSGDYILFMDADGQHRPEDVNLLLRLQRDGNWDMVVGARSRAGQASFPRHLANGFYNWFASKVTGARITDLTSGFRLIKRSFFLDFIHLLPNRFSYPTTITMSFLRAGYTVKFCPVTVLKRDGKSHIKPIKDGVRFLIIIFKVATLYSPLKVFFPTAILFFLLGLARYAYTYLEMGTFTNMSALLMVTSVQVFLIGLVSEQISALTYSDKK